MKLAVSNIAWETVGMNEHLALLQKEGCEGLEVSASMIWPEPLEVPLSGVNAFKKSVKSFGLEMPSMHSLTYSCQDLTLFDSDESRQELIGYIIKLGHIANILEIPVMIFGSSKSRQIGPRDKNNCFRIMVESFRAMAIGLNPLGVTLLIEPLSSQYTDSIINTDEAMQLITSVDHPNFDLHIDLKSSFAEKEDYARVWSEYAGHIKHCHVANPELNPPNSDCIDHTLAARAIKKSGYDRYISIEMKKTADSLSTVRDAIRFVRRIYFS